MKKLLRILLILLILAGAFLTLIKNPQWGISQSILNALELTGTTTSIANPASVYCDQNSGTLEIVEGTGGQVGMCTLSDGTVCEERAYMRGECPIINTGDTSSGTIANTSFFSDPEMSITFSYPNTWGAITKESESNSAGVKYLITLLKEGNIFFAFHNGGTPLARGSFRGDEGANINSSTYISNFCSSKTNCTLHTNTHGVQYAKYYEEYGAMGSDKVSTRLMYYFFNASSAYRGVILSNERLANELESDFDMIADSVQFN